MKKTRLLLVLMALALCIGVCFSLASCLSEDDVYVKSDVDSLIEKLEAQINESTAKNAEAINEMKIDYAAKIATLDAEIKNAKSDMDALTATYNSKVAELKEADKLNTEALIELEKQYSKDLSALKKADEDNKAEIAAFKKIYTEKVIKLDSADINNANALAQLRAEYEADLAKLEQADGENKAAIEALTKTYTDKVTALEAADKANADALAALRAEYESEIAKLEQADGENKAAIEALTKTYTDKVTTLEAADKANADALAALRAEYEADLAKLEQADGENKAAIEALTKTYTNKVTALEAADKANADALAALHAEYESEIAELNKKIAANESQIKADKAELQANVAALTSKHDSEIAALNSLITALQNADAENEARIAELEAQIEQLLSKFTVSFDVNGGKETVAPQSVARGDKVTKPADPTRDGYVFLGWFVDDEKWSFVGYTVTEDTTLKAKWISTKILSVNDGCTLTDDTLTILTSYKNNYVDVLDKIDYDKSCTVSLYADSALTAEYAYCRMTGLTEGENKAYLLIKYSDSEFKVYEVRVLVLNTIDFICEGSLFDAEIVDEDLKVTAPKEIPVSKNNGYEFSHWAMNGERVTFPYEVSCNTVFEAVFVPSVYTITYEVNEGKMPTTYATTYTVETGAKLPVPSRSLYVFDGWFAESDFSNSAVGSIPVGEYGNKILFAKWKSVTGGVKLTLSNSNNGSYYTVVGYEGADTDVVIPSEVDGIPVTEIASEAFKGKQRIKSITIPESVTSIGSNAFSGCSSLTSITIPKGVTSIGSYAFKDCSSLTSITIPEGVTSIGYNAFSDCSRLTSITIPEGVTSIESGAFSACSSLTSITIPESVTSIGSCAFYRCSSLTSITIPEGVTSIGSSAFYRCSSLTSITIPEGVTSIGSGAFNACSSLYVVYNNSSDLLFEIGSSNNGQVAYYAKVLVDHGVVSYRNDGYEYILTEDGFLFDYYESSYRLIAYCGGKTNVTLPNNVNGNTYTIYMMRGVVNVTIPEGVTSIGNYAFYGCYSLTSITIPEGVTSIGQSAFRDCSRLTSITIPEGCTRIDSCAFYDCSILNTITFEGTVTEWNAIYKSSGWNSQVPAKEVICSDGKVSI